MRYTDICNRRSSLHNNFLLLIFQTKSIIFSLLLKNQTSFPAAKWRCVHGDFEIANGQVQVKNWLNWKENDLIESFKQKNICFEMMSIASIAQLTSSDSLNFTVRMPFYEWMFSLMSSLKYLNLVIIGFTQIISQPNLCAQSDDVQSWRNATRTEYPMKKCDLKPKSKITIKTHQSIDNC